MALEQVKDENSSDLPYHNKETEQIHEERSKPAEEVQHEEHAAAE